MEKPANESMESKIAWLNEVSAGIGLVAGYILFSIYWLFSPDTVVDLEVQSVEFEKKIIGYVPENRDDLLNIDPLKLPRTKPIEALVPKFSEDGSPIIIVSHKEFRGKGEPHVVVTNMEILKPKIAVPEFYASQGVNPMEEGRVKFRLNTIMEGTGFYIPEKAVQYTGIMSADMFALRLATAFAGLSFLLFLLKSRQVMGQYFHSLFLTPMDGFESDDGGDWDIIDEDTMTEESQDIKTLDSMKLKPGFRVDRLSKKFNLDIDKEKNDK